MSVMDDTQNVDPAPSDAAAALASAAMADDFAAYERLRSAEPSDDDAVPEGGADADTGDASPEKEAEPEAKAEGDDGEGPGEEPAKRGRLPRGLKKRLDREKRKTEQEKARADAAEARLAELEKVGKQAEKSEEADAADDEPGDDPIPEGEDYPFELPDESKYLTDDDDDEGFQRFVEDLDRYDDRKPLKGPLKRGASASAPAAAESKASGKPAADPSPAGAPAGGDPVQQTLTDLQELLEEADEADESGESNVAQEFGEQMNGGRISVSLDMANWLLENEDDAHAVAKEFAARPRTANRIFRAPPSRRGSLLKSLASKLKSNGAGKGGRGDVTTVTPLRTRSAASPEKRLVAAAMGDSFDEFEAIRRQMDRQG